VLTAATAALLQPLQRRSTAARSTVIIDEDVKHAIFVHALIVKDCSHY
jgi:hypothetical protein